MKDQCFVGSELLIGTMPGDTACDNPSGAVLQAILDNCGALIHVKDRSGKYLLVNRTYEEFFHMPRERVIGKNVQEIFPAVAASLLSDDEEVFRADQALHFEEVIPRDDGPHTFVSVKFPLHQPDGAPFAVCGISTDISGRVEVERDLRASNEDLAGSRNQVLGLLAELAHSQHDLKAVQLQLIEAEKMRSVGQVAAGVAHEVRNPLAIISVAVEYLAKRMACADADISRVLADITESVERADRIIKGLLAFARPHALQMTEVDLNAVLGQSAALVGHEAVQAHVSLSTSFALGLPALRLDAAKIEQVFINVLTNAIQATPRGGAVTATTFQVDLGSRLDPVLGLRIAGRFGPGQVVVAQIDDTGPGIPPDELPRVFDPFFTTKLASKGTGLGLAVTKMIVELHAATIEIANRSMGGTRVTIVFDGRSTRNGVLNEKAHTDRG